MLRNPDFSERLLQWYDREARILPWRSDPTPYRVWISEMMLQQTRVETVIPYFQRFISAVPDIAALAAIDEDALLKLWQGLGYYSRAMNLKKAAMVILSDYDGRLPSDRKTLQKLPGIGPYSAGAISSIAFQQVETLMDGNVLRVVARLKGIATDIGDKETQNTIQEVLSHLIPAERPGDFNQALMELGATRCLPNGAPLCDDCPVCGMCVAAKKNLTGQIPVKAAKKARDIQKWTVLVLCHNQTFGIEKRKASGLLAKMWTFPMLEGHVPEADCIEHLKEMGVAISAIEPLPETKHIFTHIEWRMTGYKVEIESMAKATTLTWASLDEISRVYAIPTAQTYYLNHLK